MHPLRIFATSQFNKFVQDGVEYEQDLYKFICDMYPQHTGLDYIVFKRNYKYFLGILLENIYTHPEFKESFVTTPLKDILCTTEALWVPSLYKSLVDSDNEIQKKELRQGQFKCNNCAKNKEYSWNTTYYELQTRSSDEPMTIFITCETCKKKWKTS